MMKTKTVYPEEQKTSLIERMLPPQASCALQKKLRF
jgi:hypothetical protein